MTARTDHPAHMFTRSELADRWRVSTETLKRRERAGILRPLKMNKIGPPKRSGPFTPPSGTALENKPRFAGKEYHVRTPRQLNIAVWQQEAARLAAEYLRTGREVHRLAFERHVGGMLLRLREL